MQQISLKDFPWIGRLLRLASIYHVLLGLELLIDPGALFVMGEMAAPTYSFLVRGIGLAILIMGMGFGVSTYDPYRYWVVGFGALLSKVSSFIGLVTLVALSQLPLHVLWFTALNHLVWIPFLYRWLSLTFQQYEYEQSRVTKEVETLPENLFEGYVDQHGQSVERLLAGRKTLVVFLRHFGCTFCREAMEQLATQREKIEEEGTQVLVIHQSPPERADSFFAKYGLESALRVSDPERKLYAAFELKRARMEQVFGWKSWLRGVSAGVWKGHWVGKEEGDGWQMPGAFLVKGTTILQSFRHKSAADRVDFCELAREEGK